MEKNIFDIKSLLLLIPIIILAWVLVHVLAAFGVFLAVVYLIAWSLYPTSVPCLSCKVFKKGKHLCKNHYMRHSPENVFSSMNSFFIIMMLTFLSMFIVTGEYHLFKYTGLRMPNEQTASFVMPTTNTYAVGDTFDMDIRINDIQEPVNVIRTDIKFDPTVFEVLDVDTTESLAIVFVQKYIDNELGFIRLVGGLPNPGYSEKEGVFGVIKFIAKGVGVGAVEYLPTSVLLANDGVGTNVLNAIGSSSFVVVPGEEDYTKGITELIIDAREEVLGAKDNSNQLTFYADEEEFTLEDIEFDGEVYQVPISSFMDRLTQLDELILNWWK